MKDRGKLFFKRNSIKSNTLILNFNQAPILIYIIEKQKQNETGSTSSSQPLSILTFDPTDSKPLSTLPERFTSAGLIPGTPSKPDWGSSWGGHGEAYLGETLDSETRILITRITKALCWYRDLLHMHWVGCFQISICEWASLFFILNDENLNTWLIVQFLISTDLDWKLEFSLQYLMLQYSFWHHN